MGFIYVVDLRCSIFRRRSRAVFCEGFSVSSDEEDFVSSKILPLTILVRRRSRGVNFVAWDSLVESFSESSLGGRETRCLEEFSMSKKEV